MYTVLMCLSFVYRASREEMLQAAREDNLQSNSRSGLVDNAQPVSKTSPPQANNIV